MVKASDIGKLMGMNFWTWKPDARALLLAEGLWNILDPAVPVPTSVTSLRNWTNKSMKAYSLIYLTLVRGNDISWPTDGLTPMIYQNR
jgi:hypothetical protein